MHSTKCILASLTACIAAVAAQNGTSFKQTFNPTTIEPFLHIDLLVDLPVNTTTAYGLVARVANRGGNVTGSIEGTIVPLGAAHELILPTSESRSIYTNQYTINTTDSATVLMNANAFLQYANEALYGIAAITFEAPEDKFGNLTYDSFVGQVSADFNTGEAVLDVYKLGPNGRVDGKPIPALLAPGSAGSPPAYSCQ
ncbi:hypothetical protein K431DRAFT_316429 [Polychaeton citri CBS 116435]|uniref:Uncharacterized protein n=1 Tax=Polychaeton citri CBS 116435 TaxID=1314669 RepID=A0A9P4UKS1_9PEZI|nr:hypothetical protein K431DRAFT_316429 [Polychaeton citri CBS 116435]